MNLETELQTLIDLSFQEDGQRDITSEMIFTDEKIKEAVVIAKQGGVICGLKFVEKIVNAFDQEMLVDLFLEEGDSVKDRMMILSIEGKEKSLLRVERVILNFLNRLSGIATLTRKFVDAIEGTGAVILDTRKTVPGWRYLDKYAVITGGGVNHRMNLSEVGMIKDTHVDLVGSVDQAIRRFREKDYNTPLIVEVRDEKEFMEALSLSKTLTRILLDNFSLDQMKKAVSLASGKVLLEASGNITLENAREIAKTGVHFLSVGALTHSVSGFDFSFKIS